MQMQLGEINFVFLAVVEKRVTFIVDGNGEQRYHNCYRSIVGTALYQTSVILSGTFCCVGIRVNLFLLVNSSE